MPGTEEKKCPYCNGNMEHGFVYSYERLAWSTGEKLRFKNKSIALSPYKPWRSATAEGYICSGCRKIIIDVPENTDFTIA